jgi:Protein of unknown function (DUF1571)
VTPITGNFATNTDVHLHRAAHALHYAYELASENLMPHQRQRLPGHQLIRVAALIWSITLAHAAHAQEASGTTMAALSTSASAAPATPAPATSSTPTAPSTTLADATGPAISSNTTTALPTTPASKVGALPLDKQVRWLSHAARSGLLANMDDDSLVALFKSLDPLTLPRYLQEGPNGYRSYEFTMLRRERINGIWPSQPDHMLVRVTRDPMRIYAKWLPDGAHAGQEIIYDETKRPNEMYGHLGGLLNVIDIWTSLDGTMARSQSRHSLRDLGTEYLADQFLDEGKRFLNTGAMRPKKIEVATLEGVRVVAFTYVTPTGQPEFYAKTEVLGLDLRRPYFRTAESFDNNGKIFESVVFETITPKTFDAAAFDPKNPEYRF